MSFSVLGSHRWRDFAVLRLCETLASIFYGEMLHKLDGDSYRLSADVRSDFDAVKRDCCSVDPKPPAVPLPQARLWTQLKHITMTRDAHDDDEVSLVRSVVVKRESVKLEPSLSSPFVRSRSPVGHTEQLLMPDDTVTRTRVWLDVYEPAPAPLPRRKRADKSFPERQVADPDEEAPLLPVRSDRPAPAKRARPGVASQLPDADAAPAGMAPRLARAARVAHGVPAKSELPPSPLRFAPPPAAVLARVPPVSVPVVDLPTPVPSPVAPFAVSLVPVPAARGRGKGRGKGRGRGRAPCIRPPALEYPPRREDWMGEIKMCSVASGISDV